MYILSFGALDRQYACVQFEASDTNSIHLYRQGSFLNGMAFWMPPPPFSGTLWKEFEEAIEFNDFLQDTGKPSVIS